MKARIKAVLKSNRLIYFVYYFAGSIALRFIGLFIKVDPDLVLFVSYGGKKYDDSPRVVYEYLVKYPMSNKQKLVWAFIEPEKYPEVTNRVRIDTWLYFITALRAGVWITNSSASRGLNFRKKCTKNVLFPHGMTGIKRIGSDIVATKGTYRQAFREEFDAIFIEGTCEDEILVKAWGCDRGVLHKTGLPRNDDLVSVGENEIIQIKRKLGISENKKIILYAPTFREQNRGEDKTNVIAIPFDFAKWESRIGKDYVIIVTAHYEVSRLLDTLPNREFVINAFKYPQINDLIKISDILISDYSSIVFDYSIMERPIFCYGYDYDEYLNNRGVYTNLDELFSHGVIKSEDELLKAIERIDYEYECEFTRRNIKNKYIASYGEAAQKAVSIIFDHLLDVDTKRKNECENR